LETALGLQADGALAPLMAAFPGHLRRIPDELGTLEAAWVEPTATALRAVELAGELAGRTVLVTGGGPIGQLACRLAHLRSPAQILLMEPAAQRAQFAADSHAVSLAADAAKDGARGLAVDVVLECSGSAAATSAALKLLAPGGILVVVGAGPEPALDSATILLKEITVRGSYIYTDEFDRAIHLLATRQVTVADLTTVISALADALSAFDALRAGRIMKALIAPGTHHAGRRTHARGTIGAPGRAGH
jgi:threonine dehydrogenase-like Zn-dependent dehydrogenase